jgi:hypothetical protein
VRIKLNFVTKKKARACIYKEDFSSQLEGTGKIKTNSGCWQEETLFESIIEGGTTSVEMETVDNAATIRLASMQWSSEREFCLIKSGKMARKDEV